MNRIAFLVEGRMEQKFIQIICPGIRVQRININGRGVAIEAMAKRIGTQIRLLGTRHYPIVIVVDRENRPITSSEMAHELLSALRAESVPDEVIIGVPDQMIENWILADKECISQVSSSSLIEGDPDGFNGKSWLKKHLNSYQETIEGVELLCNCKPENMIASPSFRLFIDQLCRIDGLECAWLSDAI